MMIWRQNRLAHLGRANLKTHAFHLRDQHFVNENVPLPSEIQRLCLCRGSRFN